MWQVLWKKVSREVQVRGAFWLTEDEKRALERRLRGREEHRKLELADYVIVSFGKSGRTWLRMLLSRFYQVRYGLSESSFIGFDNLSRKHSKIPRVFFTHDNYLRDFTLDGTTKKSFYDKKVILLVRDPRDTAVSQFFQWKYRMRKSKKGLNNYPEHGSDIDAFNFVMNSEAGLNKVINFLNEWSSELENIDNILIVRYEDLRAETVRQLDRTLRFMGESPTGEEVADCVSFASVENMRRLEEKQVFWLAGSRMKPKDKADPNTYKVRRAKVGGYRDYFDDNQVDQIEARIEREVLPGFGYSPTEQQKNSVAAAS